MNKAALLASVLALAACSKKKEEEQKDLSAPPAAVPPKAPATMTPTTPTTPTAAPATGGAKLDCAAILPQALRDKYFKTAKITDNPQPTPAFAECKIDDGSATGATINFNCDDNVVAAMDMTIKGLKES